MPISPEIINKTNDNEYPVAMLSKDNLDDLDLLYREVYDATRPNGYFIKKYDTVYTGVEYVGFIAYDKENHPIAYFGVIPCFIQSGKEILLAAQAADAMTHPQYRHIGMFIKLSMMTFERCRELGIRLIFGFPNQNSYPVMIKHLGWTETGKISRFTIPTGTIWTWISSKISKKHPGEVLNKLVLRAPFLKNSAIEEGFSGVYRNEAYMRYKTYTNSYVINMNSASLWIKAGDEMTIGDIIFKENNSKDFFEEIKTLARKLKLPKISFQVSEGCNLYDLFASHYNPLQSFPVLFKDFGSGLHLNKIKFTFADIDIF